MSCERELPVVDSTFRIEPLIREFQQRMTMTMESFFERMDKLKKSHESSKGSRAGHQSSEFSDSNSEDDIQQRHPRRNTRPDEDAIKGIKMKISPFQGKSDSDAYLEWERRIELVFDCNTYSEE